ncbi:Protein disulfide-isomerase A4 [Acipenser ruthenus]|uniref:protein disulfide-isomerase n=1 Tax=Acipenser ruthenus TaxID=7906 RepID=A0A444UHX2_ACIRT|nr:Protein disulfide-isomerase A4 [Acipenser ruthenus]
MKGKKALLLLALLGFAQLTIFVRCEENDATEEEEEDGEEEDGEDEEEDTDTDAKEENGVLILTDSNFDTFVADKDTVLVEFYAPWCGHCKQFVPEYEKIAQTLKENDPPIPVAKVDATAETALGSRFEVHGYPTFKILKKGQPVDYDGDRSEKAIVAKVKEVAQPDWAPPPEVTMVLTNDNFDEVVNEADIILVEFYAPWCGHCKQLAPKYEKAAKELSKRTQPIPLAKVDATVESEVAKRFEVSGYPTLKIFRKGKAFEYNGPREEHGIVDYMIEQAGPPTKHIQAVKQIQEFVKDGDDVIIVGVFADDQDAALELYRNTCNNLREDYKFHHTFSNEISKYLKASAGQVVMMQPEKFHSKFESKSYILTITESTTEAEVKEFIEKHTLPLVGHRKQSNDAKRYTKRPMVVIYYGVDFSYDYRVGKLKAVVKSQPVPKSNKGPVKVVVGKTFEEIVLDKKKDVLIEFYAPWCGHCKQLEPEYNELGKKYKHEKNLVIAKMDSTANDIPNDNYKVEGFPTIYFAPSNNKQNPVKFEGGTRDVESLSKFLKEHATLLSERISKTKKVKMFLLGYALELTIHVHRLYKFETDEFLTFDPDDHKEDWPVVSLITEDDRHYNVPVQKQDTARL